MSVTAAGGVGDPGLPGVHLRPLFRWVGGKQQLVTRLTRFLPADFRARRYVEPFAGAASLFFRLAPKTAILTDANGDLIDCYRAVRDRPQAVARALARHRRLSSASHYYDTRAAYNTLRKRPASASQAARFIYLNRTCFNGIYRVNRVGLFNVPYGRKEPPILPDLEWLSRASETLRRARLEVCDFRQALRQPRSNDFVYLDPPYPPLNGTAFFTHYTCQRFSDDDQRALAEVFASLDRAGARVLMSNADTDLIRGLYAGHHVTPLEVTRYVTSSHKKHRVGEVVVTNYPLTPL